MPLPRCDEWFGVRGRRHLSCEDVEIVIRAQRAGLGVVVAPDAVVARAIHPADRRVRALVSRAFWHGVSIARPHVTPDAPAVSRHRRRIDEHPRLGEHGGIL
ncbi:MAG: hypothetical protein ACRDQ4_07790 [Pseudonocardiaceae bacterium]